MKRYLIEEAFVVMCPSNGGEFDPLELISLVLFSGDLHHLMVCGVWGVVIQVCVWGGVVIQLCVCVWGGGNTVKQAL